MPLSIAPMDSFSEAGHLGMRGDFVPELELVDNHAISVYFYVIMDFKS